MNGRLQKLHVGSSFSTEVIERDMAGVSTIDKYYYYQGCISANKVLIRMGQAVTYKDDHEQVKFKKFYFCVCPHDFEEMHMSGNLALSTLCVCRM